MRVRELLRPREASEPGDEAPLLNGRRPSIPPGLRVYAIGDIHGRLDLLRELERQIVDELAVDRPSRCQIVYLGDYVDRGPDSRGVIDHFARPRPLRAQRFFLLGNHDLWFRDFVQGAPADLGWLRFGGDATLLSYGAGSIGRFASGDHDDLLRAALQDGMPTSHRRFLDELRPMLEIGDYFFCHAGVRPGRALHQQTADDLVWIREPFLDHRGGFGRIVVHGHTVVPRPEIRCNRIGIDTGAVWTGRLTALVLEDDSYRFLATGETNGA